MIRNILNFRNCKPHAFVGSAFMRKHSIPYFASQGRQPRNKEEAWRMQEQKLMQEPAKLEGDDSFFSTKTNSKAGYIIVGVSVLLLGGFVYYVEAKEKNDNDFLDKGITGLKQLKQGKNQIGGDWTLVDADGKPFGSQDLQGYNYLIYFGFTNCPDICPSTLFKLTTIYRIIRNIPQGAYMKLKIVFVSVDSARDRPSVMKQYLKSFGKHIVGVTGSRENDIELKQCMKSFKIYSQKIDITEGVRKGNYVIDHSTQVYLMDAQNKYLGFINPENTDQQNALFIISKVLESQNRRANAQKQLLK